MGVNVATLDELVRLEYQKEQQWARAIMEKPAFSKERDDTIAQAYRDISDTVQAIAEADGVTPESAYGANESYAAVCELILQRIRDCGNRDAVVFYEAGVGMGAVATRLAQLPYVEVRGCEVAPSAELRKALPQIHASTLYGSLKSLPDSSIDLFYWNDVMEHIPPDEIEAHINEMSRCVKPGGYIFTITPNRLTGPHDITRRADPEQRVSRGLHLREYTLREVTSLFRRHGFKPAGIPLPRGITSKPCVVWKLAPVFHRALLAGESVPNNPFAALVTATGVFAPAWSLFAKPAAKEVAIHKEPQS